MKPARVTSNLSGSLHQRLNAYALAAGAAGVSVLALAQPVEAKIVYTKADVVIGPNGVQRYNLDLNHDGIADFTLQFGTFRNHTDSSAYLDESAPAGNGVMGSKPRAIVSAAALYRGAKIARGQAFYPGKEQMVRVACAGTIIHRTCITSGNWVNVANRYLGLKFKLKGKTHYGWARLSVQESVSDINATLTGYAYETIPNKPIIAGKTHGNDEATLGHLATGASAIPAWRVEPTTTTTH